MRLQAYAENAKISHLTEGDSTLRSPNMRSPVQHYDVHSPDFDSGLADSRNNQPEPPATQTSRGDPTRQSRLDESGHSGTGATRQTGIHDQPPPGQTSLGTAGKGPSTTMYQVQGPTGGQTVTYGGLTASQQLAASSAARGSNVPSAYQPGSTLRPGTGAGLTGTSTRQGTGHPTATTNTYVPYASGQTGYSPSPPNPYQPSVSRPGYGTTTQQPSMQPSGTSALSGTTLQRQPSTPSQGAPTVQRQSSIPGASSLGQGASTVGQRPTTTTLGTPSQSSPGQGTTTQGATRYYSTYPSNLPGRPGANN